MATNQLVAMGLNNNQTGSNSGGQFYMARILGYTVPTTDDPDGGPVESVGGAGAFFKLNDFGVGARTEGWHNLKVELTTDDGLSTDYAFYVDGVLAEKVDNIGTAASIRSYDVLRLGSGNSSTQIAYYDNVKVETFAVTTPTNDADFNNDGVVDGADFLIWQQGFGTPGTAANGDANGDLAVDGLDLDIWKTKFGGPPAVAAVAAVPEPTTLALAGVAMVAAGLAAARRR